jgi:hypothetical protein
MRDVVRRHDGNSRPGLGGAIIKAYIASHPLLALAALALATVGRLRYAIMALAPGAVNWLNYMPSVVRHGLDFGGSPPSRRRSDHRVSLMGAAPSRSRPQGAAGAATMLVSIPTLFDVLP